MDNLILRNNEEIESLKDEIRKLEFEINQVVYEIADAEKMIHDFGIRHASELGDIIKRLLQIRKEKLEHDQNGSETKKREFEEAKNEYEQYTKQYEETISENQFHLNEEEKKELKSKYRKATKLCHPDLVIDEFKEHAEIIFRELQKAYEQNDLKRVNEILEMLENGLVFIQKSEGSNTLSKLKTEFILLQNKLIEVNTYLSELKNSETYKTILQINNWDDYFELAKEKLIYELESIRK